MSLQLRAVIFADERASGFTQILRDFLYKMGFRQTIYTSNPIEISNLIHTNHWPVVFVDHTDGAHDGLQMFESIYKTLGHQLFPYIFTAPSDNQIFNSLYESIGAVGLIKKPIHVASAEKIIKAVMPQPDDQLVKTAHHISNSLIQGNYKAMDVLLERLREFPQFKRQAEMTLIKLEMTQGLMSKVNDRFRLLLKDRPKDLRVLAEYAEFLKKNAHYFNTLKCYQRIQSLHPELTFKLWDQVTLHIELEQINEAARLLETVHHDINHKEHSAEAMARMMHFLGLQNNIANFLKTTPSAAKNFHRFNEATQEKKVSSS